MSVVSLEDEAAELLGSALLSAACSLDGTFHKAVLAAQEIAGYAQQLQDSCKQSAFQSLQASTGSTSAPVQG